MKFRRINSRTAVSECGRCEIRIARFSNGKDFYNGWIGDKHVSAGFNREQVKRELMARLESTARQTEAA